MALRSATTYAFRRVATLVPTGGELWVFGAEATTGTSAPSFILSCTANEDGSADLPDPVVIALAERPDASAVFSGAFDLDDAKTGTWRVALDGAPADAWATADDPPRLASTAVRDAFLVIRYRVEAGSAG